MSNKYYEWWHDNKPLMALIPAVVFWLVSMIFFVVGLKFSNPIFILGWDASMAISISLTISNTIIQIIGNEQEAEGMGVALWFGWIASYVLGIGTNIVGLLSILAIENTNLEWGIAFGLGTIIEVLPERLLVLFLKTWEGHKKKGSGFRPQQNRPNIPFVPSNPAMSKLPKKPQTQQTPPWAQNNNRPRPKPAHSINRPPVQNDDDDDLRFMS